MSYSDGEGGDPYADLVNRWRRSVDGRHEQQAGEVEQQRRRQAAIERFVSESPPPTVLSDVARDEWVADARAVAEQLFPGDPSLAPNPEDVDCRGVDDPIGERFLAIRARRVDELRQQMDSLAHEYHEVAKRYVQLGEGLSSKPVKLPTRVGNFTDKELAGLSLETLTARIENALRKVSDLRIEVKDLGLSSLSRVRAPFSGGMSSSIGAPPARRSGAGYSAEWHESRALTTTPPGVQEVSERERNELRQGGRLGRPGGDGHFRSRDDADSKIGNAIKVLIGDSKPATQLNVIAQLTKEGSVIGELTVRGLMYWVKEVIGFPDWVSYRESRQ